MDRTGDRQNRRTGRTGRTGRQAGRQAICSSDISTNPGGPTFYQTRRISNQKDRTFTPTRLRPPLRGVGGFLELCFRIFLVDGCVSIESFKPHGIPHGSILVDRASASPIDRFESIESAEPSGISDRSIQVDPSDQALSNLRFIFESSESISRKGTLVDGSIGVH